jgi:hypothetical protein
MHLTGDAPAGSRSWLLLTAQMVVVMPNTAARSTPHADMLPSLPLFAALPIHECHHRDPLPLAPSPLSPPTCPFPLVPPPPPPTHTPPHQITMVVSITLRVGSMAEQSFNAVERVEEYCHLPVEEQVVKPSQTGQSLTAGSGHQHRRGRGGGGGSEREPLLPVVAARGGGGGGGVAVNVPSGWPSRGGIQFQDVQLR